MTSSSDAKKKKNPFEQANPALVAIKNPDLDLGSCLLAYGMFKTRCFHAMKKSWK